MQVLSKRLSEPVGDCLHHNGVVVVVILLVSADQIRRSDPGGRGKGPR